MVKKYSLILEPSGQAVEVAPHTTVMEAVKHLGTPLRNECGGVGVCGKCCVKITPADNLSALTESERSLLSLSQIQQSYRAACQVEVQGDAIVTLPEKTETVMGALGKGGTRSDFPVDPLIERVVLESNSGLFTDSASNDVLSGLLKKIKYNYHSSIKLQGPEALRQLSLIPAGSLAQTVVIHEEKGITSILNGAQTTSLGLAVDIGTTTIAAYLCDLRSGKLLVSEASVNPQRNFGEDVISRIAAVQDNKGALQQLQNHLVTTINKLAECCLEKVGEKAGAIDEVVVVGNTTMQTIFAGISPASLGRSPYLPVCRKAVAVRAADVGLDINPGSNVYLFPVISGFLGGDAVAASIGDGFHLQDTMSLVIDIGTNGEVVLGNSLKSVATSCATGPALEGANISCGMRATPGAICKVWINEQSGQPDYIVIGDDEHSRPAGICGSGLIDAMATMRRIGVLKSSGRLDEKMAGVICDKSGIGQEYVLVPPDRSATGQPISITLKDVRAFQLAKSALSVGIDMLMQHLKVDRIERTVLTGAFGAHFNWQNAVAVGMIPEKAVAGEVFSAANLAGVGAMLALLDKKKRLESETLALKTKFVELAMDPGFNERFVAGTAFPDIQI